MEALEGCVDFSFLRVLSRREYFVTSSKMVVFLEMEKDSRFCPLDRMFKCSCGSQTTCLGQTLLWSPSTQGLTYHMRLEFCGM